MPTMPVHRRLLATVFRPLSVGCVACQRLTRGAAVKCTVGGVGQYPMISEEEQKKITRRWLNPDWEEWLMGWPVGWTDVTRDPENGFRPLDNEPSDIYALTDIAENRSARVKAIGNGQVPLCAAIMFEYGLELLD